MSFGFHGPYKLIVAIETKTKVGNVWLFQPWSSLYQCHCIFSNFIISQYFHYNIKCWYCPLAVGRWDQLWYSYGIPRSRCNSSCRKKNLYESNWPSHTFKKNPNTNTFIGKNVGQEHIDRFIIGYTCNRADFEKEYRDITLKHRRNLQDFYRYISFMKEV